MKHRSLECTLTSSARLLAANFLQSHRRRLRLAAPSRRCTPSGRGPAEPSGLPQPARAQSRRTLPAKAKRVIFLFMAGGPSHLDTFDWKPELAKAGPAAARASTWRRCFKFQPSGQERPADLRASSRTWPSTPTSSACSTACRPADAGHQQATVALHTGSENFVRPSLGAWVVYGLGTRRRGPARLRHDQSHRRLGGAQNYGSAFLPATFQGTRLGGGQRRRAEHRQPRTWPPATSGGSSISSSGPTAGCSRAIPARSGAGGPDRVVRAGVQDADLGARDARPGTRAAADPRALRPRRSDHRSSFGTQCLMARRLAEKGVRFIQLTSHGWDHHNNLREAHRPDAPRRSTSRSPG